MTSFLQKLIYKPFTISVKYTLRRYERVFKRNYIVSDYNLLLQVKSTDISTYDFFTIAKYQDENDFLIKHIRILFLLYYYGIRVLRLFFRKENTESTKVKKLGNSSYIVLSKYKKNDWVYFFTDNISYDYMISLKIIFHSSFKEFQIAFKHRSIFERLRFRIIDNNRLVFEVVAKGVFFNELKVLPFSLDMNRKYDIDVVVMKDVYAFCVDGEALMTIVDKQHLFEDGGAGLVFWDEEFPSNIHVTILEMNILKI